MFGVGCWGFPVGSDGKESACSVGDSGLISGSGISPGEGTSYLSGLDLGGAWSPGPASDCSRWNNLEPEQCGQEGYTRRERGQTQCGHMSSCLYLKLNKTTTENTMSSFTLSHLLLCITLFLLIYYSSAQPGLETCDHHICLFLFSYIHLSGKSFASTSDI